MTKMKNHNPFASGGLLLLISMYFYASLAWVSCAIAWPLVWIAEGYSPNEPRLRSFRLDQRNLWGHLTQKK